MRVARALLCGLTPMLGNEPVSMVDASLRATILETLRRLNQEFGISLVYITHDLTTAYQISQNVIVLYRGSVAEAGDVDKVVKEPAHPYTQLLIGSIPLPDPDRPWQPLMTRADTSEPHGSGCKFADRCPFADITDPRCRQVQPPFFKPQPNRVVACYRQKSSPTVPHEDLTKALSEPRAVHDMVEADRIIGRARELGVKVEVAEQYYRRPIEQLKLALLAAGTFGRVLVAENDFMGHAYHGVSLIRSYIGFETPIDSVSAFFQSFAVAPHHAWIAKAVGQRREEWQHGVIRFADGRWGIFNWSSLAYDSSLRWWRSTSFFAERGMAIADRLTVLSEDGRDPRRVEVGRRFHNVGGMETLSELVGHTNPEWCCVNPL